jgi:hypothetical protein
MFILLLIMRSAHSIRYIYMTDLDVIFTTIRAMSLEMNKTSSAFVCAREFVIPSEQEGC